MEFSSPDDIFLSGVAPPHAGSVPFAGRSVAPPNKREISLVGNVRAAGGLRKRVALSIVCAVFAF